MNIDVKSGVGSDLIHVLTGYILAFASATTTIFTKGPCSIPTITLDPSAALSDTKQAGLFFTNNGDCTATVSGTPGSAAKTASVTVTTTVGSIKVKQKLTVSIN